MENTYRSYLAELLGTFAVVFVSGGVVCANALAVVPWSPGSGATSVIVQPEPGLLGIALAAGFIYAAALASSASLSGGYLNPAITVTLWVFKRLDNVR